MKFGILTLTEYLNVIGETMTFWEFLNNNAGGLGFLTFILIMELPAIIRAFRKRNDQ